VDGPPKKSGRERVGDKVVVQWQRRRDTTSPNYAQRKKKADGRRRTRLKGVEFMPSRICAELLRGGGGKPAGSSGENRSAEAGRHYAFKRSGHDPEEVLETDLRAKKREAQPSERYVWRRPSWTETESEGSKRGNGDRGGGSTRVNRRDRIGPRRAQNREGLIYTQEGRNGKTLAFLRLPKTKEGRDDRIPNREKRRRGKIRRRTFRDKAIWGHCSFKGKGKETPTIFLGNDKEGGRSCPEGLGGVGVGGLGGEMV